MNYAIRLVVDPDTAAVARARLAEKIVDESAPLRNAIDHHQSQLLDRAEVAKMTDNIGWILENLVQHCVGVLPNRSARPPNLTWSIT